MAKQKMSFWQIWNMNFGFLGIQFGWGLQMANMSAIYVYLNAKEHEIPILWLAAPLTGLLVQPIIGQMSDRTWGPLGRRRPYFLIGAILSSLALVLMPNSTALWMAAGLLWVLDASINISMQPFRALVTDMLPDEQRTAGYSMQSVFIGFGAVVSSALPFIIKYLGIEGTASGSIPYSVKLAFYIGAVAFFAAVLWTVITTKELPPEPGELEKAKQGGGGLVGGMMDILRSVKEMPKTMRQLAWVQIFTWLGLFCMWMYFGPAIAKYVFNAPDNKSPLFEQGTNWGGVCFSMYSLVCMFFAFAMPRIASKYGPKLTHGICLAAGGIGLLSVGVIQNQYLLLLSMVGVGIAWSSTLAMPFAILSTSIPEGKAGVFMGLFNSFVVIPEIVASVGFGWVMNNLLGNNMMFAVVAGGAFMLLAGVLMYRVDVPTAAQKSEPQAATADAKAA